MVSAMIDGLLYRFSLLKRIAQQPAKYSHLVTSRAGLHSLRYMFFPPRHGALDETDSAIRSRQYGSYDEYLRHQRSKLALLDLGDYDKQFRSDLRARLQDGDWQGKSVLCLAARIGTEVRAFHDVGAFAVGIDLNPGKKNYWVLPGDFHNLAFPDDCVDGVYCNSLDHALDLGKVLAEVRRVLKPTGLLMVDAQGAGLEKDNWTATAWANVDALIDAIEKCGFAIDRRRPIQVPQPGEELRFTVAS